VARKSSDAYAVRADDLSAAVRALGRFDRDLQREAKDALRTGAKTIQAAAQAKVARRPGGGTYPRRRGMVGRSVTQRGAGIKLRGKKYPWAWGAEWGAKRAWVFGRVTTQGKLSRRQFPVWRGNQFVIRGRSGPGWIIQPAIRENLDRVTEQIVDDLGDVMYRALRQAGLKPKGLR